MSQYIPDFSSQQASEPPQTTQVAARGGGSARPSQPSCLRGPGGAATAGLVIAGLAVAAGTYFQLSDGETEAHDYLATPTSDIQLREACLDSSNSVDADGQLSQRAAAEVVRQIRARANAAKDDLGTEAVDGQPAMRLTARVVRADSYQTDGQAGYVERVDIPAVSGLAQPQPATGSDVDATAGWADAKAKVEADRKEAASALDKAATSVKALLENGSDGSDVIGCAGAALEAGGIGTAPSVLIVSDLKDTALTNPSGTNRDFSGDWSGSSVHIVLACPSGRQDVCDSTADSFTDRLTKLGITDVEVYRPDRLNEAVTAWLGPQ